MKLAWMTDIHLNHLMPYARGAFLASLADANADALVITGDIGEAPSVGDYLRQIASAAARPVYFVLGNHDFYRGSIVSTREHVTALSEDNRHLHYLTVSAGICLSESAAIIGHDCWSDGGYGNWQQSDVTLMDYRLIREFKSLDKHDRLDLMRRLAGDAVAHLRNQLAELPGSVTGVVVLSHPPPFREVCLYDNQIGDDDHLPHFSCQALGDWLIAEAEQNPHRRFTVLCGHTHHLADLNTTPNLRVQVGHAEYGLPAVQQIIELT
ncbi:MAG: metallophosphoesterase [candidate division Zixibacteria bacterium]|nr:metallophosphoesterase [candidate division Zixibacteria bacterium]